MILIHVAEEAGQQGAVLARRKILKLPCHKGFRANKFINAKK